MLTLVKLGIITVVVTMFSVTLTYLHAVAKSRVLIVGTGTSLMDRDFHSLMVAISLSLVKLRGLIYVVTEAMDQLVSIGVILKQRPSMVLKMRQYMWDYMPVMEVSALH